MPKRFNPRPYTREHKRARLAIAEGWERWGKKRVDSEGEEEEFEVLGFCALAALARSEPDELLECPALPAEEEKEKKRVERGAFSSPPQK